jgi:hypothetical protein
MTIRMGSMIARNLCRRRRIAFLGGEETKGRFDSDGVCETRGWEIGNTLLVRRVEKRMMLVLVLVLIRYYGAGKAREN